MYEFNTTKIWKRLKRSTNQFQKSKSAFFHCERLHVLLKFKLSDFNICMLFQRRLLAEVWREWHMTKSIILCIGVTMFFSGFYFASTLPFAEYGPWIISACFVGVAGLLIATYSLMLVSV